MTLPDALKDGLLSGLITEGHARALAAIDDPDLMVEAYKIILKESGSVRRAEELARRMKAKANQDMDRSSATKVIMRIVSDDIDKMQEDMTNIFANFQNDDNKKKKTSVVKLIRSQRETRIQFIFKGNLEETEERLQKLYKAVAGS